MYNHTVDSKYKLVNW